MSTSNRPLSPHLQIYRPQITTVMSILHRITGFGLAVGAVMATWWLVAIMSGTSAYEVFYGFCKSFAGQALLFCWLFAFVYHFTNGIRHLFWDAGRGIDMSAVRKSGLFTLVFSLVASVLLWISMEL